MILEWIVTRKTEHSRASPFQTRQRPMAGSHSSSQLFFNENGYVSPYPTPNWAGSRKASQKAIVSPRRRTFYSRTTTNATQAPLSAPTGCRKNQALSRGDLARTPPRPTSGRWANGSLQRWASSQTEPTPPSGLRCSLDALRQPVSARAGCPLAFARGMWMCLSRPAARCRLGADRAREERRSSSWCGAAAPALPWPLSGCCLRRLFCPRCALRCCRPSYLLKQKRCAQVTHDVGLRMPVRIWPP